MTLAVGPNETAILQDASALGLLEHTENMRTHLAEGRWLGSANRYRRTHIKGLTVATPFHHQEVGELIAASVPLHLFDAWNYLGYALRAQTCGMPDLAIHLGYYAQLRAAMALLATQGIGIFDGEQIVINARKEVRLLGQRATHDAAWAYLQCWGGLSRSWDTLGKLVAPLDIPLEEWLRSMYGEASWNPVAEGLLTTLGIDLERMRKDRNARNAASYQPTALAERRPVPPTDLVAFLSRVVRTMEPSGFGSMFHDLDLHLLRSATKMAYRSVRDIPPFRNHQQYREDIANMISSLAAGHVPQYVKAFLFDATVDSQSAMIVEEALKSEDSRHQLYHMHLISRATILLRVATGAASAFLHRAGLDLDDMRGWWGSTGTLLGLWEEPPLRGEDLFDEIWLSVDGALEDIESWCSKGGGSVQRFYAECSFPLHQATNLAGLAILGLAS